MKNSRREFLRLSAVMATGLALPLYGCGSGEKNSAKQVVDAAAETAKNTLDKFGIQLYTLKEDMAKDHKEVLRKVASYGYQQVESFEGKAGMFWGMGNKDFKSFNDDLGLEVIASHCSIFEGFELAADFEQKAAEAAEIDMKYLICPWIGPQESLDDYKRMAEAFNKAGEVCKKNNLRFAYHNHDYSFKEQEGQIPQNVLLDNTDKDLVDFEMDIYWVVMAGANPQEYMKQYPNRFKLGHVKDRRKDATAEETHASTVLGSGTIDYKPILRAGKEHGMEYFFIEQEEFKTVEPLEASRKGAEYLKTLQF